MNLGRTKIRTCCFREIVYILCNAVSLLMKMIAPHHILHIFCVGSILNVFLQIIFCSKVFWAHGALESYFILQMSFIVSIFRTFLHCFSFKRTQKSGAGAGLFCHFDLQISMIIKKYIYQECLPKSLSWRCYSCGSSKEYGSKKNEISVYQL